MKTIQINLNSSVKDQLNKHYLTSLPEFVQSLGIYRPILYTFRAPVEKQSSKLKQITAKAPPFYLLFDHTIAVVWSLFDKESRRDNLGIVQLHWALYFLESISNTDSTSSKDVLLCIETIRDYLIDAYSEMSEESVVYGNATLNDFATKEVSPMFSWNYSNMLNRCPVRIADTETADSKLLEELENVKQLVGIQSIDLSYVQSYDQIMDILKKWQKEQLVKIQEDEKTLHVVVDMIRNLGENDNKEHSNKI